MANYNTIGRVPVPGGDKTFANAGAAIAAYLAVKLDTAHTPSATAPPSVVITASDVGPIGFTVNALAATTGLGLVQLAGLGVGTASATIHVGDVLMTDSAGKVLPQTAGHYQVGIAQSEAVSGDLVLVQIAIAKNA